MSVNGEKTIAVRSSAERMLCQMRAKTLNEIQVRLPASRETVGKVDGRQSLDLKWTAVKELEDFLGEEKIVGHVVKLVLTPALALL